MKVKGEVKNFMTHQQIAETKKDISDITNMVNGTGSRDTDTSGNYEFTAKKIDAEEWVPILAKKKRELKKGTPEKLKGAAADKAYANVKKCEKWIKEYKPRDTKVLYPKGCGTAHKETAFEESVENEMKWIKHGNKIVQVRNSLMRQLDPQNRNYANIDHL